MAPKTTSRPTDAVGLRTSPGAAVIGHGGYPSRRRAEPRLHQAAARRRARPRHDRPPPRPAAAGLDARRRASPAPSIPAATATARCATRRSSSPRLDALLARRARRTSPSSRCRPRSTSPRCASSPRAGVHVLVEKPLAATAAEDAREIAALCAAAGVRGAVGHVERFNPALLELRRRVQDGQLGEVFLIATERIGPFPDRVRDVGVVKDLATHDLDLVRWLGGAPVERLAAQTQHRMGRDARGPRARHRAPGERRQLQLRRRLAVADEGPPHAGPRRARDARRRHADRRPDLLRERRRRLGLERDPVAARRQRGRHDALRAARAASRCWSSSRRSATSLARRRRGAPS